MPRSTAGKDVRTLGYRAAILQALATAARDPRRAAGRLRHVAERLRPAVRYQFWLRANRLRPSRVHAIARESRTLEYRPTISIVMPVFNTPVGWLESAIDSVIAQAYPFWELCVVDDGSTSAHVDSVLHAAEKRDARITVSRSTANEGIARASNRGLERASGDFVALLDHDDTLAPDALFEVAKQLNRNRSLDLVYTDHDVRTSRGRRVQPFFKPDWSPDLLLSMNYITHLCVYRRSVLTTLGGFREGVDGSQDYDLLLRVSEQTDRIAHIRKPLYSWGQSADSAAANPLSKSYAHEAGRRALRDALERRGIDGDVLDAGCGLYRYRVRRRLVGTPMVSIIVPTRDNRVLLERCISSIEELTTYRHFDIIIVDNDSTDPATRMYLDRLPHRVLRIREPFNFARLCNAAAGVSSGEHLLFLNDDTEVIERGWLDAMLEHAQRPEVGAVGARLLFPNGTIQHAGVVVGIQGKAGHAFWGNRANDRGYFDFPLVIRNYSAVTGACLMVRRAVFDDMKGFDETFAVSYNDVDLCLRLRQRGYLVVYTPYAVLYHHQSATRGPYDPDRDRAYEQRLRDRWRDVFERGDPYYSPHLTLSGFDFRLKYPPDKSA
jgi:O-antigen biosynthesis protein